MDESDPNRPAARLDADHPAVQRIVRIVDCAVLAPTAADILEELNLSGAGEQSHSEGAFHPLSAAASTEARVDTPALTRGVDPPPPRELGYDEKELNKKFALVVMGGKAVIIAHQPEARLQDQKQFWSKDAFHTYFANQKTEIRDHDGKIKVLTFSQRWMSSAGRRTYEGIEFHPNPDGDPGTPGYFNLWEGFAVKPAPERDPLRYKTFRDHLLVNVCRGDENHFRWVFGYFAHIVQRPRDRIGTALVMCGKMGSGKTKVGEIIGRLFPAHYFLVDDARYVTGQFNAHMATCLLLQADEAVWAGDKAAEGRLKGLITSSIQQIEAKGVDPIRLPNYVRLIMTSNEEWVVPAGKDERRFCVLDVDGRCAQNHDYFREMDEELAAGGLQHLLADLLAFDLSQVNLRLPLRTEALLEQKLRSLDSIESWWVARLIAGATTRHASTWRREVPTQTLFNDYIATSDKVGMKRKQEETSFGMKMRKLVPGLAKVRRTTEAEDEDGSTVTKRVWCYRLPFLSEARAGFERLVGQEMAWPAEEDTSEGAAPGEEVEF